ncbi:uncharacterized protein LOC135488805 [Lineus longissimus]|uniref:uncharacterized protein LOC135488805 n=1 Tax=Lineus longissimus TaxID=88925 RepID=UPI002B4E8D3B
MMNFCVVLVVLGIAAANAIPNEFYRFRRSTLTAKLNNGMEQKIRSLADGNPEVENALNEYKRSLVRAFDETLKENFRQVREVLTDRRRSVDTDAAIMNVKRAFDTMEDRVHQKALRDLSGLWNSVKDWVSEKFSSFADFAKDFLSDVYEKVKPDLVELKDMALELIKTHAKELSTHAKEQALKFFREQGAALADNIKEQLTEVLG